jgi:predicted RecA/RadA family phage recombinase
MTKAFRQEGKSIEISGVTTTVASGSIYRRSGNQGGGQDSSRAYVGVVTDEIIGTSETLTTLDGRPIQIGDGVAAEAQTGTGKGDAMVEGVFTLALPASGMVVYDADPLYMNVADTTNPGTVASGVTNNQDGDFVRSAISGALVGFAVGDSYTGTSAPFTGLNVVDVKLLGLPLHGLADAAPAEGDY